MTRKRSRPVLRGRGDGNIALLPDSNACGTPETAGLARPVSPHRLRHFFLTWLKKQGIDDALIQPYSGHASRQSLEAYSRLAITQAQEEYNSVMQHYPI